MRKNKVNFRNRENGRSIFIFLPHNKDRTRFVDRGRSRAALMAAEETNETFTYMKLVNDPLI